MCFYFSWDEFVPRAVCPADSWGKQKNNDVSSETFVFACPGDSWDKWPVGQTRPAEKNEKSLNYFVYGLNYVFLRAELFVLRILCFFIYFSKGSQKTAVLWCVREDQPIGAPEGGAADAGAG